MIKFLEKKFKFDFRYFLSGGSWLFLGQIISTLESVVLSVFLARSFGASDFGKYVYVMAVFSVANVFGAPGMSVALFQSVSRGYEGTLKYLTRKVFFIGLLGSAFLVLFQLYFNFIQKEENQYVFLVLAVIFPFYSISTNYAYFVSGVRKFKDRTRFELVMNIFILLCFFSTFLIKRDIYLASIILILSQTIICLAYVLYLIHKSNDKVDHHAYDYGKKMNWNYAIPTMKMQLDRILLSNFLGYAQTAMYNVSFSLGDQVTMFAKILGALIVPKSSNLSKTEIRSVLNFKNIMKLLLLFIIVSLVLFFLCPFIISILYGENYFGAILYAKIILLFIPIRSFSLILKSINESQKNTKILGIMSNYMSILEMILMFFGLLFFKLWGLIIAKIVSDFIGVVWQLVYIYKEKEADVKSTSCVGEK